MAKHIHNMTVHLTPPPLTVSAVIQDSQDEVPPSPTRYQYLVCDGPAADAEDPWRNGCGLDSRIVAGSNVRVVNWAGPCIRDTVISVGPSRYKLDFHGFKHFIEVHVEPCNRCTDHPQSHYPNGYTN